MQNKQTKSGCLGHEQMIATWELTKAGHWQFCSEVVILVEQQKPPWHTFWVVLALFSWSTESEIVMVDKAKEHPCRISVKMFMRINGAGSSHLGACCYPQASEC